MSPRLPAPAVAAPPVPALPAPPIALPVPTRLGIPGLPLADPLPADVAAPATSDPTGASPSPGAAGAVAPQPPLTGGTPSPTTSHRASHPSGWLPTGWLPTGWLSTGWLLSSWRPSAAAGTGFGLLAMVLVLGARRRRPSLLATGDGGLVQILEMLEDERANGAVALQHGGKTWRIYLRDGHPYHADGPRRSGERVIIDALRWPRGSATFRFEEALRARAATVRRSLSALIHEARYP